MSWFTPVIPTRDSAAWIGPLLAHYQARGVTPVVLLDNRTTDFTRAIVTEAGARVVDIHSFSHTEATVKVAAGCVETLFALFIHDDEIPSDALFRRLAGPMPPAAAQSVAIPRRWAWYEPGKPLSYGHSTQWHDRTGQPGNDHSWRLFRPRDVTYTATMHSEGFYIKNWSRFSLDEYFVHFEWILRSRAQREAKLRRYDEHRYGYGAFFRKVYLPETQPPGVIEYAPFETAEFDLLAQTYYAARRPDGPLPRISCKTRLAQLKSFTTSKLGLANLNRTPRDRAGLHVRPEMEVT
jgi:hypothetical protein